MSVRMVNWKVLHPRKLRRLIILLILILTLFYARKHDNGKKKKDWHNYTLIRHEEQRIGLGEQGRPALPEQDRIIAEAIASVNGLNGALSDKIPLNRSLPDVRHPACKKRLYLESLPPVSVIVPFYNEYLSVLLRTIYSVQYRAPEHLIKEIFIVDDGSTRDYLKEKLDKYVAKHMPKVKVLRLANQKGIVAARLLGAKAATADVLVFLDSHVEANVNWLPPLLEPLVLEHRTVVCSLVDGIDYRNFMYNATKEGKRGIFNWGLYYSRVDILSKDITNMPEPFETPVMMGGMFAIKRDFFWELGGYDTGLKNWGGDQFEFSFKNYRRVVEVWMDEYAEYVYERQPNWRLVDPGDLTEQKALRKKLKCKPFKWFMTQVAYDLPQYYPLKEPAPYAEGWVRPMLNPKMCVDGHGGEEGDRIIITPCQKGSSEQIFQVTWYQDIMMLRYSKLRIKPLEICWDAPESYRGPVLMYQCHREGGNQQWKYREDMKAFVHLSGACLDHNPNTLEIFMMTCDWNANTQKWTIDNVNGKQMQK